MPKIFMIKTAKGANDGIDVKDYVEGNHYDVSESLAKDFLSMHVCEVVPAEADAQKSLEEAPKNKAHKFSPKTKSVLKNLGDK
jgi:hypothetical protein